MGRSLITPSRVPKKKSPTNSRQSQKRPRAAAAPLERCTNMGRDRLELRAVRLEDEKSFRAAVDEFKKDSPDWGFAFDFDDSAEFSEYVQRRDGWSQGVGVPSGFVPNTFLVGVVDGLVVGRLSIRHYLNERI